MESTKFAHLDGILLDGLEFCARSYALYEQIRQEPGGRDRLRIRKTIIEKRVLEELLPICRYVQTFYGPGRYFSVKWQNGSQTFDAELYHHGERVKQGQIPEISYLEVTCAMHENEHCVWKLLSEQGFAFGAAGIRKVRGKPLESAPVVFTNTNHVNDFVPIVLEQLSKKAAKPYPANTSLIVQCYLNRFYFIDEWRELVAEVERRISTVSFKEVLLIDGANGRCAQLKLARST